MTAKAESRPRRFHISARTVLALVIVALIVVFVIQNRTEASIYLFLVTVSAPLWLVLAIVAAIGLLAGYLLARRH